MEGHKVVGLKEGILIGILEGCNECEVGAREGGLSIDDVGGETGTVLDE